MTRAIPPILAALLVGGCLGAPVPATRASGIQGLAMLGPTCPVQREPPDPACADKPYHGTLAVTTADGSRVVATFAPRADGSFNVSLDAGAYAIANPPGAAMLPRCASGGTFDVRPQAWTLVNVSCDTGIR